MAKSVWRCVCVHALLLCYGCAMCRPTVRHEDLQNSSFASNSLDIIVSTEVFEHIPLPYKAHVEVHRVLKPGGAHVFTCPFIPAAQRDLIMSRYIDGQLVHNPLGTLPPDFVPPLYHADPVRPDDGILVYTIFGQELFQKLCLIGFDVEVFNLYNPEQGAAGVRGVDIEGNW